MEKAPGLLGDKLMLHPQPPGHAEATGFVRPGNLPQYEVIALKYATRGAQRPANFLGGDPHDAPMHMDYYVWIVRNADRLILIDTGFDEEMAVQRHRTLLRRPAEGLRLLGIDAAAITD